jgi:hypothetical protein
MRSAPSIVSISLLTAAVAGLVTARPVAAAETPVASTSLAIRNRPDPGDPSGRKIKWSVKDAAVVAGTRGTAGDPRCIGAGGGGAGGSIRVFSDRSESSTEDTGDISLPCTDWRATGSETKPTGYVYVDGHRTAGPCSRVIVRTGKGVKATCTGTHAALDYDLRSASTKATSASSCAPAPMTAGAAASTRPTAGTARTDARSRVVSRRPLQRVRFRSSAATRTSWPASSATTAT